MPKGKGKALQFIETEPPALQRSTFIYSVLSLSLYFRDLGEPTHARDNAAYATCLQDLYYTSWFSDRQCLVC